MELQRWSEWTTPRGGSKSRSGARKWRTSQVICSLLRTTSELGYWLGEVGRDPAWQDLGLIGGMIGYLIGVTAVVGVEDAQG